MDFELTQTETRVLGCLLEKEMTTPEYYPLTLLSLTTACNQKTNRHPVVDFDEKTVARAIAELREKGIAFRVDAAGARVPKYKHSIGARLELDLPEKAVLAVLLLRGPQTLGELRARTERMYGFENLDEVADILEGLGTLGDPVTVVLPPRPGQKEKRFAHLLSGQPEIPETNLPGPALETATLEVMEEKQYRDQLNAEIDSMKEEMTALKSSLEELKSQFSAFKAEFE